MGLLLRYGLQRRGYFGERSEGDRPPHEVPGVGPMDRLGRMVTTDGRRRRMLRDGVERDLRSFPFLLRTGFGTRFMAPGEWKVRRKSRSQTGIDRTIRELMSTLV